MSAIKSDRDYLIGAEVVIETNCLPILVMISSCTMPDMAMLHWIAYVKSLYPEIQHVAGKGNVVVDILSRARYSVKEDPHSDEEDVGLNFFKSSFVLVLATFIEEDRDGEFVDIGKYLSSLQRDESWSMEGFH